MGLFLLNVYTFSSMVRSILPELQTLHGSNSLQPRQNMWFWRETGRLEAGVFTNQNSDPGW